MGKNNCFANNNPCSGCAACYSVCPVGAICLERNSDGFFEARVNAEKCISCGKCVQVCPKYFQQEKQLDKNAFSIYSFVYNETSVLKESSSGAAGWALTEQAVAQGYAVAGVVYDPATDTAKVQLAQTLQQAQAFKGSKYLQADTSVYKDLLKREGKFMVFGTPCQIAGLSKALDQAKRRDDFLLVDCFCHGVPSYLMWHAFLKHIGIEHPKRVDFRSKKGGWHNYYMEIISTEKTYRADVRKNPFYALFFSDLLLNKACYTCTAKSATFADIRLGDFWGADYDLTDKGVSLVVPLSARGQQWTESLKKKGTLKDIRTLRGKIVKSQSAFSSTVCKKALRAELLEMLKQKDFVQALILYRAGMSAKKKLVLKVKSLLPLWCAKYVRFVAHKLKGY